MKSLINSLIKCWKEISIVDKSLIIIMIILLAQCIYNLFNSELINPNAISINVIVRTSVASIFGYFLSENFLKSKDSNIVVPLNTNNNSIDNSNSSCSKEKFSLNSSSGKIKDYICNKFLQILISLSVCIICLLSLIIANNFNLISPAINPTVIQFRDLIGSCLGFLLGHSNNSIKKN